MKGSGNEVADIIRRYGQPFLTHHPQPAHHLRTLQTLAQCRTAALGGHVDQCQDCGHKRISYNSCRNRHCPKCQGLARERWQRAREDELLDLPYFHVVFTLPAELHPLCLAHPRTVYGLLFQTAWQTICAFARDPKYLGAKAAMSAILHTWGQNLSLHPHLHCIVPGGGMTEAGKWKEGRSKDKFLFPVKAMSKVFRAKFVAGLRALWTEGKLADKGVKGQPCTQAQFKALCERLFQKPWVIYAKRPFAGPKPVIAYLARYTHRIAISNQRITQIDQGKVSFQAKDYRSGGKKKTICLQAREFLRRFCLHILPHRFVRIRHFGWLAPNQKAKALQTARKQLGQRQPQPKPLISWQELLKEVTGWDIQICPRCQQPAMKPLEELPRAPPNFRIIPVSLCS